jgi:hypothetical protein
MISVEQSVEGMARETKPSPSASISTTNPKYPDLCPNPGRCSWKPATNRLTHGTAISMKLSNQLTYLLTHLLHEQFCLLRYTAIYFSESQSLLVACFVKMEARYYSAMSVDFQRTAQHFIPENETVHNSSRENLKS